MAKVIPDQQATTRDTDVIAAFPHLAKMCEDILQLYAMRQPCPAAIWREVGKPGSEAYECIDLFAIRQPAAGACPPAIRAGAPTFEQNRITRDQSD
jgi:hypothetical protein